MDEKAHGEIGYSPGRQSGASRLSRDGCFSHKGVCTCYVARRLVKEPANSVFDF